MPDSVQQALNEAEIAAILAAISPDRFKPYLQAAGFDQKRAFRLYLWNARLGEAFHIPIQAAEVALRNSISVALSKVCEGNWWECEDFLLDRDQSTYLSTVLTRIRNRNLELYTGEVIAGLSFGFWVGILGGYYNRQIWSGQLRTAFPHLPAKQRRRNLQWRARGVAILRNKISHHEPLIDRDNLDDFSNLMTLLKWICPAKAAWIRPHCRVPEIVRQRP